MRFEYYVWKGFPFWKKNCSKETVLIKRKCMNTNSLSRFSCNSIFITELIDQLQITQVSLQIHSITIRKTLHLKCKAQLVDSITVLKLLAVYFYYPAEGLYRRCTIPIRNYQQLLAKNVTPSMPCRLPLIASTC